jgi:hypothetical protein
MFASIHFFRTVFCQQFFMADSVYVKLTFHKEATLLDRDHDIAYLDQFLEPLIRECSAFKSYHIATSAEVVDFASALEGDNS